MQKQLIIDPEVGKPLHFIGLKPGAAQKSPQILRISGDYFTLKNLLDNRGIEV